MPIVPFRLGSLGQEDPDVSRAVLVSLRDGPSEQQRVLEKVRDYLDRPGLRGNQIAQAIQRLSGRGLVSNDRLLRGRVYSLTIAGHEAAARLVGEEDLDALDISGSSKTGPVEGEDIGRVQAIIRLIYEG